MTSRKVWAPTWCASSTRRRPNLGRESSLALMLWTVAKVMPSQKEGTSPSESWCVATHLGSWYQKLWCNWLTNSLTWQINSGAGNRPIAPATGRIAEHDACIRCGPEDAGPWNLLHDVAIRWPVVVVGFGHELFQ